MQSSGETRREKAKSRLDTVIARSESAMKLLRGACHRAALRADPLARNDGAGCLKLE
jgi:hypothetical protein